jgi:acyl-coenzyme A synthetase/AMP-(fatty) acid ligase
MGTLPRRLSYGETDRIVSSLAAMLADAELPRGSVVAMQLPNTVEAALTCMAAWRAG